MLDTIGAYLQHNSINIPLIKPLLGELSYTETKTAAGIERKYHGYIQNMKVNVDQHGISTYGSLPKFLNGNNVQALNSTSLVQAVEKLSDTLHFPMHEAKVIRLDTAQCLSLSRPPSNYFEQLLNQERRERLPHKYGVYFRNKQGENVFYDKIAEIKKNKLMSRKKCSIRIF